MKDGERGKHGTLVLLLIIPVTFLIIFGVSLAQDVAYPGEHIGIISDVYYRGDHLCSINFYDGYQIQNLWRFEGEWFENNIGKRVYVRYRWGDIVDTTTIYEKYVVERIN